MDPNQQASQVNPQQPAQATEPEKPAFQQVPETPTTTPPQPPAQPVEPPKQRSSVLAVVLVLLLLAVIGVGAYWAYQNYFVQKPSPAPISSPTPTSDPTANWKTYVNTKYNFQLKYPEELEVNRGPGNSTDEQLATQSGFSVSANEPVQPGANFTIGVAPLNTQGCNDLETCLQNEIDSIDSQNPQDLLTTDTTVALEKAKKIMYTRETESYSQSWVRLVFILNQNLYTISTYAPTSKVTTYGPIFDQILSTFKFLDSSSIEQESKSGYYTGEIWSTVPYKGLKFLEINVHNFQQLEAELDKTDYHFENTVIDGYTFIANEGEDFEFLAEEDRSSNPGSFIRTELYGYGPSVIKMDTRIGWGVPVTGRYFYVVKGEDFYGPNFVVPDGSGKTYDGSKYGKYILKITQRK